MLKGCEGFTSLIQQMRISRKMLKIQGEKLEVPMPAAMALQDQEKKVQGNLSHSWCSQDKVRIIVEADESTRKRVEGTLHKDHEDHIAGQGIKSWHNKNLVHKFIPMPQALRKSRCKCSSGERIWKTRENTCMAADKSQKQKRSDRRSKENKGRKVHFASLMDLCHLKNSDSEPQYQKYKSRVVLRGEIVKDDSESHAVFAEEGSCASHMTAAKVRDVISWLPERRPNQRCCISIHSCKNGRWSQIVEIVGGWSSFLDTPITLLKSKIMGRIRDLVVPLERHLYGHPWAGLLWERTHAEVLSEEGGNALQASRFFLSTYVDDIKMTGKTSLTTMWDKLMSTVDVEEPTPIVDQGNWGCT